MKNKQLNLFDLQSIHLGSIPESQAIKKNERQKHQEKNLACWSNDMDSKLYLCLFFPILALEVSFPEIYAVDHLSRKASKKKVELSRPRLVYERVNTTSIVYQVCEQAHQLGIRPGMSLSQAYTKSEKICCRPRNQCLEKTRLQDLLKQAGDYSAELALAPNQGIFIEINYSLKLFGGLLALLRKLFFDIKKISAEFNWAVALSAKAAYVLAVNRKQKIICNTAKQARLLANLSLAQAGLSHKQLVRLKRMGIHKLGQLWRLPRAGLARRFGLDMLNYIDAMRAMRTESLISYHAEPFFLRSLTFELEVTEIHLLLQAIKQLLTRAVKFLVQIDAGCNQYSLFFFYRKFKAEPIVIRLKHLSQDLNRLYALACIRLEGYSLQHAVTSVSLQLEQIKPYVADNTTLFAATDAKQEIITDERAWQNILEDLGVRLGDKGIVGLETLADHRPELAWRYINPVNIVQPVHSPSTKKLIIAKNSELAQVDNVEPRPSCLLSTGIPLSVKNGRLYWRSPLCLIAGPERIESGWWDGKDIQRDYYIAVNDYGQCYWVYCNLKTLKTNDSSLPVFNILTRSQSQIISLGDWYLQGVFA